MSGVKRLLEELQAKAREELETPVKIEDEKVEDLEAALDDKASSPVVDRTVDQVLIVSKIVRMKYWLIRGGMALLGSGLCLCALSVILDRFS